MVMQLRLQEIMKVSLIVFGAKRNQLATKGMATLMQRAESFAMCKLFIGYG